MYEQFYGFEGSGFKKISDRRLRFWHDGYTDAFEILLEAMRRGQGFVVLTGAPGTGKSTLIDDLAARFEIDGCMVGKVTNSLADADDLSRLVAFAFGLQADAFNKTRLLTKLKEKLIDKNSGGQPVILLIDEAQDLSVEALQELRLLFDLIARRGRVVQILLSGQERLRERLRQPECGQIRQLVAESSRLLPLSPNETRAYIAHALEHIGWRGRPEISADALRVIHERTGGVPRLINLTMGRLVLHGSLGELHALGSHDVETVLEQLGEDHPELLLAVSKQELPSHHASSQPLLPLDMGAAAEIQSHKLPVQKGLLLPVEGRNRNASARAFVDRLKSVAGWNWQWTLAGLSAAAVSVYMVFSVSFEGDGSVASAARESGGQEQPRFSPALPRVDQSAPEQAETLSEPNAHTVALVEADREVVDLGNGTDRTENLESDLVENESEIAKNEPSLEAHQDLLVDTLATAPSAEIPGAAQPSGTQAEDQQQQEQADPETSELLVKAEGALSRNRLLVPSGDNAYAYYRTVLARDPGNARARAGVQRIVQRYRQLAQQRLNRGDRRGARLFASRGLKIRPRDRQLLAIKRRAGTTRAAKRKSELPEIVERVEKWFRSGDTTGSAFLDQ